MRRWKKTSKLRVTGLCERNSPVTGEFPAQRVSNAENVSIWWRNHDILFRLTSLSLSKQSVVSLYRLYPLHERRNERDGVSNHQPHDCLPNRLVGRRSKKISKLRVTGLCEGKSPVTGEFPAQRASDAENVSIRYRHHVHADLFCRNMIGLLRHFQYPLDGYYWKETTKWDQDVVNSCG